MHGEYTRDLPETGGVKNEEDNSGQEAAVRGPEGVPAERLMFSNFDRVE